MIGMRKSRTSLGLFKGRIWPSREARMLQVCGTPSFGSCALGKSRDLDTKYLGTGWLALKAKPRENPTLPYQAMEVITGLGRGSLSGVFGSPCRWLPFTVFHRAFQPRLSLRGSKRSAVIRVPQNHRPDGGACRNHAAQRITIGNLLCSERWDSPRPSVRSENG